MEANINLSKLELQTISDALTAYYVMVGINRQEVTIDDELLDDRITSLICVVESAISGLS